MPREGPGFIEDLVLLWIILIVWIGSAEAVTVGLSLSGTPATVVAIGLGVVIAFVALYGYYWYFLDETPLQPS